MNPSYVHINYMIQYGQMGVISVCRSKPSWKAYSILLSTLYESE